jgi:hypothetical protein
MKTLLGNKIRKIHQLNSWNFLLAMLDKKNVVIKRIFYVQLILEVGAKQIAGPYFSLGNEDGICYEFI